MIAALLSLLLSASAWAGGGLWMVEVKGSINPGSASYILQSLRQIQEQPDSALVIKLDTPGGLLASTRTIIQGMSESRVPVVVWVAPSGASATSAGALIALSAHVVAMQSGSNIGAAHPVGGGGEDIKGVMGEKVTNDTAALARSQAALRGRDVAVAEEIVTKSRSFTAAEAVQKKVADFLADDETALLRNLNGRTLRLGPPDRTVILRLPASAAVNHLEMSLQQRFLHFISDPNVSAILLSVGGMALWAEVSSGFSAIAPGVIAVFCFALAFVSLQTLPVNTGGLILLLLGFAMLVAEAFVTSYGLLGFGALVCIFLGGLFLIDPGSGTMQVSLSLLISLVAGVGIVMGFVGWMLARDRRNPRSAEPNALAGAEATVSNVEAGGRSGTAYVHGELWAFESTDSVATGETHLVGSVHGLKIHLKRRT